MSAVAVLQRIARWSARWAAPLIVALVALSLAGAFLVFNLKPAGGAGSLLDRSSADYRATRDFQDRFGADPLYVLISGKLTQLLYTADLARIVGLEGCLSGNVPAGAKPPGGVCTELAAFKPAKVVYGPGTFINESARVLMEGIEAERSRGAARAKRAYEAAKRLALSQGYGSAEARRLGRKARQLVYAEFVRDVLKLSTRYGLSGLPSLGNPEFVNALVFSPERGAGEPKSRFAYLFPDAGHALIQIRLRSDLNDGERRRAVRLVEQAVHSEPYRLENGAYTVSGAPALEQGVSDAITGAMAKLLLIAAGVMALMLAVLFRVRRRLLPLGLALAAAVLAFGAMSAIGAGLTLASVAVMPVLIGLGVDYAVQLQASFNEAGAAEPHACEIGTGEPHAGKIGAGHSHADEIRARRHDVPEPERVDWVARSGAPAVAVACLATLAGMLALGLSPVPMVRSFGVLLVVGVALAFILSLTAGLAILTRRRGLLALWPARLGASRLWPGRPRSSQPIPEPVRPLEEPELPYQAPSLKRRSLVESIAGTSVIRRPAYLVRRAMTAIAGTSVVRRPVRWFRRAWASAAGATFIRRPVRAVGHVAKSVFGRSAVRNLVQAIKRAGEPIAGVTAIRRLSDAARRGVRGTLSLCIARPGRVLVVAILLAAVGWMADTQVSVVSDLKSLLPGDLPAVVNVGALQEATGSSGEIDVVVEAKDVTAPRVVRWMTRYESRVLRQNGYSSEKAACERANLCPGFSLTSLFRSDLKGGKPTSKKLRSLLEVVPPYFSQGVVDADRRTAVLAFGLRVMPLDRQKRLIDGMKVELDPPRGVRAGVVGLPVLAADTNAQIDSSRRLITLLAMAAVLAILLLIYRNPRRAMVPLVPILLAGGWSALALFLLGVPLNPMSAALGVLVVAISTEFSVILAERYRRERGLHGDSAAALWRAYRSTGKAVAISALTVIAGFAVLITSDIRMVRDFGLVAVVDLVVALVGVMVVLPAALIWVDRRSATRLQRGRGHC